MGNCPDDDMAAGVIAKKLTARQQFTFDSLALKGAVEHTVELEATITELRAELDALRGENEKLRGQLGVGAYRDTEVARLNDTVTRLQSELERLEETHCDHGTPLDEPCEDCDKEAGN